MTEAIRRPFARSIVKDSFKEIGPFVSRQQKREA
jgi:hypothetical protein